jgi:hypothetical protein
MTQLFERLRLQTHFKRLFDEHGVETGWQLIQQAAESEGQAWQCRQPEDDQQQQDWLSCAEQ